MQKQSEYISEIVTEEVALKILSLQPRCVACGSTFARHIHHRIFRSEGEDVLSKFLERALTVYAITYKRQYNEYDLWHLHDIQNLVVLCIECHEGRKGVHGGNEKLRQQLRNSFTCPITGFNIPFRKIETLF